MSANIIPSGLQSPETIKQDLDLKMAPLFGIVGSKTAIADISSAYGKVKVRDRQALNALAAKPKRSSS